jgi:hypothetical protein
MWGRGFYPDLEKQSTNKKEKGLHPVMDTL